MVMSQLDGDPDTLLQCLLGPQFLPLGASFHFLGRFQSETLGKKVFLRTALYCFFSVSNVLGMVLSIFIPCFV